MPIDRRASEPPTREQRLGAVTGYIGTLKDLTEKACEGCLQNRDRRFTTVNRCSHMTAISSVLALEGALVVDHAPVGCSGVYMVFGGDYDLNNPLPDGSYRPQAQMVTTKLTETDTIFGATEKLRAVVRAAYDRHHPKEIYIASSCVSAIIGEDIDSVCAELSEEFGIPVTPLAAAGLKSRVWASGFDAYSHASIKSRMRGGGERTESIVYSGFAPIAAEELRPVFERLGLDLICLTGGADAETFERATAARCSFGQCFVQADYFLEYLEQEHGVKRFLDHQPNGGIGFERFLRDLAAFLGKEDTAEEIIAEERAKYAGSLERLRGALAGRRAVIALGPGYAFEAARMLGELGVETAHAIAYHYDPGIGRGGGMGCAAADVRELGLDVEASLSNAQELETYLIIKRLKPDIVVSRAHGANGWAAKMGIPCLDMGLGLNLVGYRGLHLLGHGVESVLRNTAFLDRLGARYVSPFSELLENMDPRGFCGEGGAE